MRIVVFITETNTVDSTVLCLHNKNTNQTPNILIHTYRATYTHTQSLTRWWECGTSPGHG